ncbi:MAG: substrate-binding domain-containing protein [Acidimicrobiales bacterium]|jgi:ribose transport system substrate-binding protein|nr:substrate-binding domain-containing protein [Acidimicrobiales bacterium]
MKKLIRMLALLLAFTLIAAACGDDEDSGDDPPADDDMVDDSGDGDVPAGVAAAQAVVDANSSAPTSITPSTPLDSVPGAATVAWLECELPSCAAITPGFEAATDLLGWDLEIISVQSFDPAPGFQQAIDLGVDYIAITGTPPALVQDQITAAADAGIAFMSCFDTTDPDGPNNNIWTNCGDDDDVFGAGGLLANAVIADSGGDANVLMVNIPDFAVLVSEREGAQAAYDENCPDCTFTELAVTIDQLIAGEVAGAIVAALQSDPDINYVHFAFDGLTTGVSTVLADAGLLEGVSLVGVDFSGAVLQEIVDGTHQFWTANPKEYAAWIMVDAMARHSIGQDNPDERSSADLPNWIASSAAEAEPLIATNGWPGPDGMADQFATLWGLG